MHLVEHRKLNGHQRKLCKLTLRFGLTPRVLQVEVNNAKAMTPVAGKTEQNEDIRAVPDPFQGFHCASVRVATENQKMAGTETDPQSDGTD